MYQATVTTNDSKPDQTYVGLTSNAFKTRFANHKTSFTNVIYMPQNLVKHVWKLKDKNVDYKIKWKIIKQAKPYSNNSNRCNLFLWEKYFILCHPSLAALNKRNELVSSCRHANKFLLRNFVTWFIYLNRALILIFNVIITTLMHAIKHHINGWKFKLTNKSPELEYRHLYVIPCIHCKKWMVKSTKKKGCPGCNQENQMN